jgi:hypothetical protein
MDPPHNSAVPPYTPASDQTPTALRQPPQSGRLQIDTLAMENDIIIDEKAGDGVEQSTFVDSSSEEAGVVQKLPTGADADPFGNEEGADIKFKTMSWQYVSPSQGFHRSEADGRPRQTASVMIAETVSLGILSLPSTLKAVGLVP